MIFVDTNVFMYAVGGEHPLRLEARSFFEDTLRRRVPLATSAEVLQEFLHAYLPVGRLETLDAAMALSGPSSRRTYGWRVCSRIAMPLSVRGTSSISPRACGGMWSVSGRSTGLSERPLGAADGRSV